MDRTSNVLPKAKYTNAMSMASKPLSPGTNDSGIILGALALPGNPYDGHTIDVVLKQLKRITGTQPAWSLIVDTEEKKILEILSSWLLQDQPKTTLSTKKENKEKDSEKELV